jgi:hypothetical protein
MLIREAKKINEYIETSLSGKKGVAINIGSSTANFIEISQPYIKNLVLNPLTKKFEIINVDIKNQKGVDLVADFTTTEGQRSITNLGGNLYLISNLLEHIPDYHLGIQSIIKLLNKDDYLILSGPKSFPYHPDPIDNMFRPSTKILRKYFENDFNIVDLQIVKSGTVFSSSVLMQNPRSTGKAFKSKGSLIKLLISPSFIFKIIRNVFYPASAFCMLAIKK